MASSQRKRNSPKRSPSYTDAPMPLSKRSCSTSPAKPRGIAVLNRVHRRVVLRDYGMAIYIARSCASLLAALGGCIEGHGSLHTKAGRPSLWIELDLAIKEQQESTSGARGKTGTRAFMAIGAPLGEQHSFMHDLE